MAENIKVVGNILTFKGTEYHCAIGKNSSTNHKREGDNCSPKGIWPIRKAYYRADKTSQPKTILSMSEINKNDGWCDAPEDENYNKPVKLPYPASHEKLWRDDDVYDVIVELGYNDDPVIKHKGSAIFMHVAKPNYEGTEGCIAVSLEDLLEILSLIEAETQIEIS